MSIIKMSDEEKQKILEKHKQSIKDSNDKKEELKKLDYFYLIKIIK